MMVHDTKDQGTAPSASHERNRSAGHVDRAVFDAELGGSEILLRIVEALEAAHRPVTFAELLHGVGTRDPAQLHYHLDRIVGRFVEETEQGYELGPAGRVLIGKLWNARTEAPTKRIKSVAAGPARSEGP